MYCLIFKFVAFSRRYLWIFFQDEANPVQMRCQYFYSAVMANSKLDYWWCGIGNPLSPVLANIFMADTAFSYTNKFNCSFFKKLGKLPTHWKSEVATKWKRNCITGALHRAKPISVDLVKDINSRNFFHQCRLSETLYFACNQQLSNWLVTRWQHHSEFSLRRTKESSHQAPFLQ